MTVPASALLCSSGWVSTASQQWRQLLLCWLDINQRHRPAAKSRMCCNGPSLRPRAFSARDRCSLPLVRVATQQLGTALPRAPLPSPPWLMLVTLLNERNASQQGRQLLWKSFYREGTDISCFQESESPTADAAERNVAVALISHTAVVPLGQLFSAEP